MIPSGRYDLLKDPQNPTAEQIAATGSKPLHLRIRKDGEPQSKWLNVQVRVRHYSEANAEGTLSIQGFLIINGGDRGTVTITYSLTSKTGTFLFAE